MVPVADRISCGDVPRGQCEAAECCWTDRNYDDKYPRCFYPSTGNYVISRVGKMGNDNKTEIVIMIFNNTNMIFFRICAVCYLKTIRIVIR